MRISAKRCEKERCENAIPTPLHQCPYLRPSVLDVDLYENSITKPYHVGHTPFYCLTVMTTFEIRLKSH